MDDVAPRLLGLFQEFLAEAAYFGIVLEAELAGNSSKLARLSAPRPSLSRSQTEV